MRKHLYLLIVLLFGFLILGCPPSKETTHEEKPAVKPEPKNKRPDIVVQVGSINLFTVTKKIERADITQLSSIVRHEKLDIVTVQGITRYPDLKNRLDFVDEFSSQAEMRQAFGEMINISGKQTGNAIFSTYPIRSNENTHYENLHSTNFEAVLQGVVDCGARDVTVMSTRLPDRASTEDQSTITTLLSSISMRYINQPIIITGNLSHSEMLHTLTMYQEAQAAHPEDAPHIWYSSNESIKLISVKIEKTSLGKLIIAQFGIFRQGL
jgi:endonuclease/exonuclease/phosphatase family metal-dependent hydrolase